MKWHHLRQVPHAAPDFFRKCSTNGLNDDTDDDEHWCWWWPAIPCWSFFAPVVPTAMPSPIYSLLASWGQALKGHSSFYSSQKLLFAPFFQLLLFTCIIMLVFTIFPRSSVGKSWACNVGNSGSIPGLGRSPGEWNGNPLQCSCLENPMDRGGWRATVHGVARVRHNWATEPALPIVFMRFYVCLAQGLASL